MDTLTFQNRSLRDRAKRFEEALRKSTDEQIVVRLVLQKKKKKAEREICVQLYEIHFACILGCFGSI